MIKKISILLISLIFFSCASLDMKEMKKVFNESRSAFSVKWNTDYKFPTDKQGYLVITNPQTKKSWKMKYKDFFITKRAYENWRTVEASDPIITSVEEKGKYLIVTFNYIDSDNISILSGQFIIDTSYINSKEKELLFWRTMSGAGWLAFLIVLLI